MFIHRKTLQEKSKINYNERMEVFKDIHFTPSQVFLKLLFFTIKAFLGKGQPCSSFAWFDKLVVYTQVYYAMVLYNIKTSK